MSDQFRESNGRHGYQCLDAATSSTGEMRCATCGTKIISGEYLSYKKTKAYDWGYVTHHRACQSDHPLFAKRDREIAAHNEHARQYLIAAEAFRDTWETDDLDETIDDLRELLSLARTSAQ